MNASDTTQNTTLVSWGWTSQTPHSAISSISGYPTQKKFDMLKPARNWLENLEVSNSKTAHFLCKLIPSQCPFERDIKAFGRTLFHIPPLCKLNPLYEEVVGLRFRALCYLADQCGEDVTSYC